MVFENLLYYELIFYLGIIFFIGYLSSIILDKVGIPNVVVYLMTGFLVGNFLIPDLYHTESLEYWYTIIEAIALGLIGFKVGTEMHLGQMKNESFLLFMIIMGQIVFSFVLVFIGAYLYLGNFIVALIFGGLATASAPAATVEIIRKYKASGPLTQRISWTLALIDVAAVLIVETILIYSSVSLLGGTFHISELLKLLGREIGLAFILGLVGGLLLDFILEKLEHSLEKMEVTLGSLILCIGIAEYLHASVIITTIMMGVVTVNIEGKAYEEAVDVLEIIMSPILILFFVLVGSEIRIEVFTLDLFPWFAIIYFVLRAIGKIFGSYFGAGMADGSENVKKYLGLGMVPQGGLVLGLVTIANRILTEAGSAELGELIVLTIIIATFFSEALGSFGAVFALSKAGEISVEQDKNHQSSADLDY